jgi:uncharacterized protein (TIGR02001 family)
MKTTRLFAALLTALCVSPAFAQAEPDYTFTGNAGLFSDYRFRGFSQTNLKPAIQGGFDFAHKSGFYAGNWNSNVASELYGGGNLEMDFYGGYKGKLGDFGYDVGLLYYYYPGSNAADGGDIDNTELYVAGSYGPFTAKYSHGLSNFFGAPDTKNTHYLDLGLVFDLGNGWGANAHVGYQSLKKSVSANGESLDHYLDYKAGVTKDLNGWLLGASVVATSEKNWYLTNKGRNAGRTGLVVSLSKAF